MKTRIEIYKEVLEEHEDINDCALHLPKWHDEVIKVAMTRFAEMAWCAKQENWDDAAQAYIDGKDFDHFLTFKEWLSQQEGGSNE